MAIGRKWGFHSGVLTCLDAKIKGDLYVQDDIVFSDVSAGRLGVTGGIDFGTSENPIGIDMSGTFSTNAIDISGTTNEGIDITPTLSTGRAAGVDVNLTTVTGTTITEGITSTVTIGADVGEFAAEYTGVYGMVDASGAYTVGNNSLLGGNFKINLPTGDKESRWNWGVNISVDASKCTATSSTGCLYGLYIYMHTGTGTFEREDAIRIWHHDGGTNLDNVLVFSGECDTAGINFTGGTFATGVSLGDNCTTGINIGDATTGILLDGAFTTGIKMVGGVSYNPIHIGVKDNVLNKGLVLTASDGEDMGGIMVFCDDGGVDLTNSWTTSPIWTRYLITVTQTANTATGAYLQLKLHEALNLTSCDYSAIKAYLEVTGAVTLATTADLATINVTLEYTGVITVTSGSLAGIKLDINDKTTGSITDSAKNSAGVLIMKNGGSSLGWPVGLKINDAGAITGIQIGNATTGIILDGTYTSRVISGLTTMNNSNTLGDGYGAVELDLTITGTTAGHMAGLSSWVTLTAGTHGSDGAFISAQTNGVYEATGATISSAKVIFGMRAQYQGDDQPSQLHMFSIHSPDKPITAIFEMSSYHDDTGFEVGSGSSGSATGYLRLISDSSGTPKYVRLYDGTS